MEFNNIENLPEISEVLMSRKEKAAVIGAGIMGLTCAYELLKKGYSVTIFEKDDRPGGMSASFDFGGLKIERYYHFVCGPDYPLFELLKELEIIHLLKWEDTKMGFFYNGTLYKWGNPVYLLLFPKLDIISKLRFGLHVFISTKRTKWYKLDKLNAIQWIKKNIGNRAYNILWKSLFDLKFYEYKNNLSAAWIWTRIKRVGLSRKNILKEKLGYIEGGSDVLISAMEKKIKIMGGKFRLNTNIKKINIEKGSLKSVEYNGKQEAFNKVISTIPLPYISQMIPGLPVGDINKYKSLQNIGVVCVILKLKNKLTDNFWLNINDNTIEIPGMIEYTNLNPLKENILYVPYYLHKNHKKYNMTTSYYINEVIAYCKKINKDFNENWILLKAVHKYEYAQPICPPGFLNYLPAMVTGIKGLYIADTSHYYPEDRSISESIRIGKLLAESVING
jgi:protoporphyrinogen oxidase